MGVSDMTLSNDEDMDAVGRSSSAAKAFLEEIGVIPALVSNPPEWFVYSCFHDEQLLNHKRGVAFEEIAERPGWYKAVLPLLFTHMIIVGRVDNDVTYEDRWCFTSFPDAYAAFKRWNGLPGTEPNGWHRHPMSGRRREYQRDGSFAEEIIY